MIFLMLCFIACLVIFAVSIVYSAYNKRKVWNNGVCPICKSPWQYVGRVASGDYIYSCDSGHTLFLDEKKELPLEGAVKEAM